MAHGGVCVHAVVPVSWHGSGFLLFAFFTLLSVQLLWLWCGRKKETDINVQWGLWVLLIIYLLERQGWSSMVMTLLKIVNLLCSVRLLSLTHCTASNTGKWTAKSVCLPACSYLYRLTCSAPQGYINSNAVVWPDVDYIGLLSSHFICTAFTSVLKKASHALQNTEVSFRWCNFAFKNNLSKVTMEIQSYILMFKVCI